MIKLSKEQLKNVNEKIGYTKWDAEKMDRVDESANNVREWYEKAAEIIGDEVQITPLGFTERECGIKPVYMLSHDEFEAKQKSEAYITFSIMLKKEEQKMEKHISGELMMTERQYDSCEKAIKQYSEILKTL